MRALLKMHFALMLAIPIASKSGAQSLDDLDLLDPKTRIPDLDFYPMQSGKQTAQWKRETRGRKLK